MYHSQANQLVDSIKFGFGLAEVVVMDTRNRLIKLIVEFKTIFCTLFDSMFVILFMYHFTPTTLYDTV